MFGRSCPVDPLVSTIFPLVKVTAGAISVMPNPSLNLCAPHNKQNVLSTISYLTFGAFLWKRFMRAVPAGAAPTNILKDMKGMMKENTCDYRVKRGKMLNCYGRMIGKEAY